MRAFTSALTRDDPKPRVFIDVSGVMKHLKKSRTYSGIQRVVMNIAAEFSELYGASDVFISFLDEKSATVFCCPLAGIEPACLTSPARFRQLLGASSDAEVVTSTLSKYQTSRIKFLYHRARLDLAAALRSEKTFERKQISSKEWILARQKVLRTQASIRERSMPMAEVVKHSDFLLLMDSSWSQSFVTPFLKLKTTGVTVVTLIHDLIPLEAPETLSSEMTIKFLKYIMGTVKYTDQYMANSDYTKQQLERFFDVQGLAFSVQALPLAQTALTLQDMTRFRPGIDEGRRMLANYPNAIDLLAVQPEVREISYLPFVLCVGTLESRKNIMRLAMAWQTLLQRDIGDLPRLVFAGRIGSQSHPFLEWMKADGALQGYISIINEPTDASLDYLYKKCEFFVMPSLIEGWGLPVGEALSYGKTGVVSRSSSLPEVGEDMVEYCDPLSVSDIANAVQRLVLDRDRRRELECKIKIKRLCTWRDVANDLANFLSISKDNTGVR